MLTQVLAGRVSPTEAKASEGIESSTSNPDVLPVVDPVEAPLPRAEGRLEEQPAMRTALAATSRDERVIPDSQASVEPASNARIHGAVKEKGVRFQTAGSGVMLAARISLARMRAGRITIGI